MRIRRWRKHTERREDRIREEELDFLLMDLETESLDNRIYRYCTEWGIKVVYYMFDFQLLENYVYQPIYLYEEDVYFLSESDELLFYRVLMNTVKLLQTRIVPFYEYLEGLKAECEEIYSPIIQKIVDVMRKVTDDNQLWCITNNIGERGASGAFYKPLLKSFCQAKEYDRLIIGVQNNGYAFLAQENARTIMAIKELTFGAGNLKVGSEKIMQKTILRYEYRNNTLKNLTEK